MEYDDQNVFAKILRGEIPADVVYEDERCLAFRDIDPKAPVHCVVIPKDSIAMVGDVPQENSEVLGHLIWAGGEVARQQGIGDAFRLVINHGEGGGQAVFHLHLHVLGGGKLGWPPC